LLVCRCLIVVFVFCWFFFVLFIFFLSFLGCLCVGLFFFCCVIFVCCFFLLREIKLGLYTAEMFRSRARRSSSPATRDVRALRSGGGALARHPRAAVIGTLDSKRTQLMLETLLERVAATQAEVAIVDITGVPAMDTLTAQHLINTVNATRLMAPSA